MGTDTTVVLYDGVGAINLFFAAVALGGFVHRPLRKRGRALRALGLVPVFLFLTVGWYCFHRGHIRSMTLQARELIVLPAGAKVFKVNQIEYGGAAGIVEFTLPDPDAPEGALDTIWSANHWKDPAPIRRERYRRSFSNEGRPDLDGYARSLEYNPSTGTYRYHDETED